MTQFTATLIALLVLIGMMTSLAAWAWIPDYIWSPFDKLLLFLDEVIIEVCSTHSLGRGSGQALARRLSAFAHALPFGRQAVMERVIVLVARYDDEEFLTLVAWETPRDIKVIRAALLKVGANLNRIAGPRPERTTIVMILQRFATNPGNTMTDLRSGKIRTTG